MLSSYKYANIYGSRKTDNYRQRSGGEKNLAKVVDLADAYECLREYAKAFNEWRPDDLGIHDRHVLVESEQNPLSCPYTLGVSHKGRQSGTLMQDNVWDLLYDGFFRHASGWNNSNRLVADGAEFPLVQKEGVQTDLSFDSFYPKAFLNFEDEYYTVVDEHGVEHIMLGGIEQDSTTSFNFGNGCIPMTPDFISRIYDSVDKVKNFAIGSLSTFIEPGTIWDEEEITERRVAGTIYNYYYGEHSQLQNSKVSLDNTYLPISDTTATEAVCLIMFACILARHPSGGGPTQYQRLYSVDSWDLSKVGDKWMMPAGSLDGPSVGEYLLSPNKDTDTMTLAVEKTMVIPKYDWRVEL